MIDGFYKVDRYQAMSFERDTFYNPDTHEWYSVKVSDTDDYEIERHFHRWADEPLDWGVWFTYDMDANKKQVYLEWDYTITR